MFFCHQPNHIKLRFLKVKLETRQEFIKLQPIEFTESHSGGLRPDSTKSIHITKADGHVIHKADCHKVIGRIKVRSRIDSGPQVTTITETCYNQLFRNNQLKDSTWIKLKGSNGLPIPTMGTFITTLFIDQHTCDNVYLFVVREPFDTLVQQRKLHVPGVIGSNMIKQMCGNKCNKFIQYYYLQYRSMKHS